MLNKYIMSLMILLFFFQVITANNVNIENINIIANTDNDFSYLSNIIGYIFSENTQYTKSLPSSNKNTINIGKIKLIKFSHGNNNPNFWDNKNIQEFYENNICNYDNIMKPQFLHGIEELASYYSIYHNCNILENSNVYKSFFETKFLCKIVKDDKKNCYYNNKYANIESDIILNIYRIRSEDLHPIVFLMNITSL